MAGDNSWHGNMCGIAGIIVLKKSSMDPNEAIQKMVKALHHRGPDDYGVFIKENVYLGHTRLSIIDVKGGHQPIHSPQGDTIIGNGEIYNYIELQENLSNKKYSSHSDFEPALYACIEKGIEEGIESWRGMYAATVWLKSKENLICVRDPFGIKPLYYTQTESYFAFASEPKALIEAGLAKSTLNPQHVISTLNFNYTPFEHTVYTDIKRFNPGETISIDRTQHTIKKVNKDIIQIRPSTEDDQIKEFDEIFEDSVRVHQRSDVPYGLFLSGGIDSSCILAMMARLNEKPVKTFTCGFDTESVHDERRLARRMADYYKTDHEETVFTEQDFINLLPSVAAALDDPTFDPAVLPTFKLAELAKKKVKVVLSGEGGDEVFAGYGRYRKFSRPGLLGGGKFSNRTPFTDYKFKSEWQNPLYPLQKEILGNNALDKLQKAQAHDIKTWLPADLLLKLDRCLMAHSLEGRTPFLDKHVFEFGFNLKKKFKIKNRLGKWVLREWLHKTCSAAEPFARKKGFTVPVNDWIQNHNKDLLVHLKKNQGLLSLMREDQIELAFNDNKTAWPLLFYAVWHQIHQSSESPQKDIFDILKAN